MSLPTIRFIHRYNLETFIQHLPVSVALSIVIICYVNLHGILHFHWFTRRGYFSLSLRGGFQYAYLSPSHDRAEISPSCKPMKMQDYNANLHKI